MQDEGSSGAGYDASERVLVAFNTLVGNASGIGLGTGGHAIPASDCMLANNLLIGDAGSLANEVGPYTGFTWAGNMLSGAASAGEMPMTGYIRTSDPRLAQSGGALHLLSDSPIERLEGIN